ncbi:MAG: hypothetical protein DRH23_13425, partial [Deltaproteobacteria bacterium]
MAPVRIAGDDQNIAFAAQADRIDIHDAAFDVRRDEIEPCLRLWGGIVAARGATALCQDGLRVLLDRPAVDEVVRVRQARRTP